MKTFESNSEKEKESMIISTEKSLDPKYDHLLSVCKSDNGDIDKAILKALLKAVKNKKKKKGNLGEEHIKEYQNQLKLALKWDRVDIARNYIFKEEKKEHVGLIIFNFILMQNNTNFLNCLRLVH